MLAQWAGLPGAQVEPGSASHRNLLRAGFVAAHRLTQWRSGDGGGVQPSGEAADHPVQPPPDRA